MTDKLKEKNVTTKFLILQISQSVDYFEVAISRQLANQCSNYQNDKRII